MKVEPSAKQCRISVASQDRKRATRRTRTGRLGPGHQPDSHQAKQFRQTRSESEEMNYQHAPFATCCLALLIISATAGVPGHLAAGVPLQTPIQAVFVDLDKVHKWNDSNGDTWDPAWADDDNLYASNNDGRGFGKLQRNLAFHQLSGDQVPRLVGSCVNSMDEYGKADQKGPDGATWKSMGHECVDKVCYIFVSRHTYGHESKDHLDAADSRQRQPHQIDRPRPHVDAKRRGELQAPHVAGPAVRRAVLRPLRTQRRQRDSRRRRPLRLRHLEQRLLERRRRLHHRAGRPEEAPRSEFRRLDLLRGRRRRGHRELECRHRSGRRPCSAFRHDAARARRATFPCWTPISWPFGICP